MEYKFKDATLLEIKQLTVPDHWGYDSGNIDTEFHFDRVVDDGDTYFVVENMAMHHFAGVFMSIGFDASHLTVEEFKNAIMIGQNAWEGFEARNDFMKNLKA